MTAFDAWRTRIQALAQSLDSIGREADLDQIRTRRSELVGRAAILVNDLEQDQAIPQPREDRREAWAAVFHRLTNEVDDLAAQVSPGPTILRAHLLSVTMQTTLLDTLSRIYEIDNAVLTEGPDTPTTEPKLPRFDVTYGAKLGSGAFGTVWQATDQLLERSIAVKFLTSTDESLDENALLREARSLAKIAHPNLVTVYAAAWLRHPENRLLAPAITMELLIGHELQKWQDRQQTRPDVIKVASGILTGIAAMHDAGLYHGDLHAENVLVLADATAKLIDWRYQDTFLARSTAHRRELNEIDKRRGVDLVLALMEKQGIDEALEIRQNLDFASVRVAIIALQTLPEPKHGAAGSSPDLHAAQGLWKQIDSEWIRDWWERSTNYPQYEEKEAIHKFRKYLRLAERPEFTFSAEALDHLHTELLKTIGHRLEVCALQMVPDQDPTLYVATIKDASNRGIHVENFDQKYEQQLDALTESAEKLWGIWKLYVREIAQRYPAIVYHESSSSK